MCSHDLTRSKCKGKKDIIELLPEAVFNHSFITFSGMFYGLLLSPACAPCGEPHCIFVTCVVKEGPLLGGFPSLALRSPICVTTSGDLVSPWYLVPRRGGTAPIGWDWRVSGQVFLSTDIQGAGSSTPSANLIRK